MSLGDRQQGEIAYLIGALGVDKILERLAILEGSVEAEVPTLESRESDAKANLARLSSYGASEFVPESLAHTVEQEVEEEDEEDLLSIE